MKEVTIETLNKKAEDNKKQLNEAIEELQLLKIAEAEQPVPKSVFECGLKLLIENLNEIKKLVGSRDLQDDWKKDAQKNGKKEEETEEKDKATKPKQYVRSSTPKI